MDNVVEAGTPTRVSASAVGTIGAGGPINLIGIWVPSVLTGQIVQLWTQTANSVTGQIVIHTCTLAANTFYRIPGYFPKGLTHCVTTEDVDLTIFWNPAG